jgi:hypothetical protein
LLFAFLISWSESLSSVLTRFSFFGTQEGDFSLDIVSIAALRTKHYRDDPEDDMTDCDFVDEKLEDTLDMSKSQGWLGWFGGFCGLRG